jgi:hypothetical protein
MLKCRSLAMRTVMQKGVSEISKRFSYTSCLRLCPSAAPYQTPRQKGYHSAMQPLEKRTFSWASKTMTIGLLSFRLLGNLLTRALGQMKLSPGLM